MTAICNSCLAYASPARGAHLVALRRSLAVAAVGLAVWIGVASSASFHAKDDPAAFRLNAPEWTRTRSIEGYRGEQFTLQSSCDVD